MPTDHLRRLALQVVVQLPDSEEEALVVLDHARDLLRFLYSEDRPKGGVVRLLPADRGREGWLGASRVTQTAPQDIANPA